MSIKSKNLVKKLELLVSIIPTTIADYPTVQNMARFYIYDQSRYCGFIADDWAVPADGLYECFDFRSYFEDPSREAFLVKVGNELAGFVLLNREPISPIAEHNMGEFFITAKFQGMTVATETAHKIWQMHPGGWEVSVIPENKRALSFWRKTISCFTDGSYIEEIKIVDYDKDQPRRYIFNFDTRDKIKSHSLPIVRRAIESDISAMVSLSYQKRRDYEQAQPLFWKYAGGAEELQNKWFKELLKQDDYIMLTVPSEDGISGFIIGRIMDAPEVYDPGPTLIVDDFCVISPVEWQSVGRTLILKLKKYAKENDAKQIVIVCGAHDQAKRRLLEALGLTIASEWYVGEI